MGGGWYLFDPAFVVMFDYIRSHATPTIITRSELFVYGWREPTPLGSWQRRKLFLGIRPVSAPCIVEPRLVGVVRLCDRRRAVPLSQLEHSCLPAMIPTQGDFY